MGGPVSASTGRPCIAALDVGTSSVKACLFTPELNLLACSVREYRLRTENGRVEARAEDYLEAAAAGMREALDMAPGWRPAALGLTTQGETLVPVGRAGEPLGPFLVWLDSRAGAEAELLSGAFDRETFYRATGLPELSGALPLAKALWLRREEPGVQPQLRLVPSGSLDNLLAEGDVQVMFAFQEAIPKNASYQELGRCPVACVCRGDHPLAEAEELTLEELKGAGTIAACRPSACPPSLFAIQGQLVTTRPPEQVLFCDSQEVLFTLVETGYAFAVMADFPQLRRPGLRYLPLAEYPPLSYGAAWLGDSRAPALRRFLALLRDTL